MRAGSLIALLVWLVLGYFLCSKYLCGSSVSNTKAAAAAGAAGAASGDCDPSLAFTYALDDQELINVLSANNFQFEKSNFNHLEPTKELEGVIEQVVSFLETNPEYFLQITGLFAEGEDNKSSSGNLGEGRAKSIKAYFISKGAKSTQLQAVGAMTKKLCWNDKKVIQRGAKTAFGKI